MELILAVFWIFASGSSSYLFLTRVRAVFFKERLVRHAFTVFWVAGIGASMVVLPGSLHDYYQIANTKHCINVKIKSYVSAAFIVPVLFDAFVFFAISYKILMFHRTNLKKPTGWKPFCCGEALPHLSKAVLQGGQQYYMHVLLPLIMIQVLRLIMQDYNQRQRHAINFSSIAQCFTSFAIIALDSRSSTYERNGMSCLSESQVGGVGKNRS